MKIFLAIQSCQRDRWNGRQQASRGTYLNSWDYLLPYRYILGGDKLDVGLDELLFSVPDDYHHCPWKTKAAAQFALADKADFMFHCCVDTYVVIPRLLTALPRSQHYVGHRCDEGHASGGCGYWLSRDAMRVISDAPLECDYEDRWVGKQLAAAGIPLTHDARYHDKFPIWDHRIISAHLGVTTDGFDPAVMHDCHTKYLEWCS